MVENKLIHNFTNCVINTEIFTRKHLDSDKLNRNKCRYQLNVSKKETIVHSALQATNYIDFFTSPRPKSHVEMLCYDLKENSKLGLRVFQVLIDT
jgi:hypothetical protein